MKMEARTPSLDNILFVVVTSIIGLIAVMMAFTYGAEYLQARELAARLMSVTPLDPSLELAASELVARSLLRVSSFFLSFVLIYVGALYVLRTAQASYSVSVEGAGLKGALQATSPGLVLASMGVCLILIVSLHDDGINYSNTTSTFAPSSPLPAVARPQSGKFTLP